MEKKKNFFKSIKHEKEPTIYFTIFFFSIFPYQENLSFSVLIFFFIKCIIHKDKVFLNIKQNAYLLNHFFPTVSLAPSPFFVFVTKTCRPRVPNTLMSIPLLWHYFSYLLYEFTLIFLQFVKIQVYIYPLPGIWSNPFILVISSSILYRGFQSESCLLYCLNLLSMQILNNYLPHPKLSFPPPSFMPKSAF